MTKLKDIDLRILFELMKNSKTSDQKIAKKSVCLNPLHACTNGRFHKSKTKDIEFQIGNTNKRIPNIKKNA